MIRLANSGFAQVVTFIGSLITICGALQDGIRLIVQFLG